MARESRRKRDERRFGKPERLADKAMHSEWYPPFWMRHHAEEMREPWGQMVEDLKSRIATTTVIAAENVGEYLFAVTDKEEWDFVRDFPSCVPPLPHFLIELKRPSRVFSNGEIKPLQNGFPDSWGWQCEVDSRQTFADKLRDPAMMAHQFEVIRAQYLRLCQVADHHAITTALSSVDPRKAIEALGVTEKTTIAMAAALKLADSPEKVGRTVIPDNAAWFLKAELFIEANDHGRPGIVGPIVYYVFAIDDQGQIIATPNMAFLGGHLPEFLSISKDMVGVTSSMLFPAMLAISFMNCKNVTVDAVEPPREINRERRKHDMRPFVRYHTINIEPMKRVLRTQGQIETHGLRRSLHICRGHFSTYTPERPLFGKIAGTFWVPSHVRGTIQEGIVVSDYNVKPPAGEA